MNESQMIVHRAVITLSSTDGYESIDFGDRDSDSDSFDSNELEVLQDIHIRQKKEYEDLKCKHADEIDKLLRSQKGAMDELRGDLLRGRTSKKQLEELDMCHENEYKDLKAEQLNEMDALQRRHKSEQDGMTSALRGRSLSFQVTPYILPYICLTMILSVPARWWG